MTTRRRTPAYADTLKAGDEIVGNDGRPFLKVHSVLKLSASKQYPEGAVIVTGAILPTEVLHIETDRPRTETEGA